VQVADALIPILCSMPLQVTPFGTRAALLAQLRHHEQADPLVPGGASGSRASTRWTMFSVRSCSPAEMKILLPVSR
jgi:hypothetical protein